MSSRPLKSSTAQYLLEQAARIRTLLEGDSPEKTSYNLGYVHGKRGHQPQPEGAADAKEYMVGFASGKGETAAAPSQPGVPAVAPTSATAPKPPAEDFADEFGWYQDKGIGGSLDRAAMMQRFNDAPERMIAPEHFDSMANSYTSLIKGDTPEERFPHFLNHYLNSEKRDLGQTRAVGDDEKKRYLMNLVNAVKLGQTPPVIVIKAGNVGHTVAGGRTRMAAAKVAGVPIKTKIIDMPVDDPVKAKATLDELTVREANG